jgi:hypothetical protein
MKSSNLISITISGILLIYGFNIKTAAETRIHGIISNDTKWTLGNSPYIVTGDILVTGKARLSISPGVTIMIASSPEKAPEIKQYDHQDSFSVAIKIEGGLDCSGKNEKRIVFKPLNTGAGSGTWYGIIFEKVPDNYAEVNFTDITGSYCGISVYKCSPVIKNCIIEHNNIGINCAADGNCNVYNCVIANNFTSGIRITSANPVFYNNIIV